MSDPGLFVDEPFRSLWSGRDPFIAVEVLEGEVFRELKHAVPYAPRSLVAGFLSRFIAV